MNLAANSLEQIERSIADVPPVAGSVRVGDPLFKMIISLSSVVSAMKRPSVLALLEPQAG